MGTDLPRGVLFEVIKAISSTGAIEYTLSAAQAHKQQALAQLQDLPPGAEKQAMADVAEFAYSRSYWADSIQPPTPDHYWLD